MWRVFVFALAAAAGCSPQSSDQAPKASNGEEYQVAGKTIRVIVHRKAFQFDGEDRISTLGGALNEVRTSTPFAEKDVDEEQLPYEKAKHALDTGEAPDF